MPTIPPIETLLNPHFNDEMLEEIHRKNEAIVELIRGMGIGDSDARIGARTGVDLYPLVGQGLGQLAGG